jgi:Domain of unknown function (DUF305)
VCSAFRFIPNTLYIFSQIFFSKPKAMISRWLNRLNQDELPPEGFVEKSEKFPARGNKAVLTRHFIDNKDESYGDRHSTFRRSNSMKLKWTQPDLAAQMPSVMDQFMQMMEASMTKMDKGMAVARMTGDVDHDFATMMMPLHEGAIDMAKAELSCGKDGLMRRLAEEIIVDQQSEIDVMNLWLSKRRLP